ncbi:TOBE domain-containing protein [Euzebya tangerina]|uniref:TOBE domain-containing protein n=1 Tax=Euzebya tangerina TaxID=591198 RepID=UPI000E318BF3|nr:helix-turn-helix transcriptional regulator [Euzebya tangerina]
MADGDGFLRIGQAAAVLGVSVDTLRRWDEEGALAVERTAGGQRRVPVAEVTRLIAERDPGERRPPIVASSARNQMPGVVTGVTVGAAAATVEVQAGPFRLVSLMTAESVQELQLAPGSQVIASVKSTNVVIGLPG